MDQAMTLGAIGVGWTLNADIFGQKLAVFVKCVRIPDQVAICFFADHIRPQKRSCVGPLEITIFQSLDAGSIIGFLHMAQETIDLFRAGGRPIPYFWFACLRVCLLYTSPSPRD